MMPNVYLLIAMIVCYAAFLGLLRIVFKGIERDDN